MCPHNTVIQSIHYLHLYRSLYSNTRHPERGAGINNEIKQLNLPSTRNQTTKPKPSAETCAVTAVLPDQDRALPDRAVPELDQETIHRTMLVVPIPIADPGTPPQGVLRVEAAAENPVGGGEAGHGGGRTGGRFRTSRPMGGAVGRYSTFSPLRMREGGRRLRQRTTL